MTTWHRHSRKKVSGGILRVHRKKRKHEIGRDYLPTTLGENKSNKIRVRGGNTKQRLLSSKEVNVLVGKKIKKANILSVLENPANIHFVRRNIVTKGAIIDTDIGKAVVTSKPGQSGIINAKLLEERRE